MIINPQDMVAMTHAEMMRLREQKPTDVTVIVPDVEKNKADDYKWVSGFTTFRNAGLKDVRYITHGRMSMPVTTQLSVVGIMPKHA